MSLHNKAWKHHMPKMVIYSIMSWYYLLLKYIPTSMCWNGIDANRTMTVVETPKSDPQCAKHLYNPLPLRIKPGTQYTLVQSIGAWEWDAAVTDTLNEEQLCKQKVS